MLLIPLLKAKEEVLQEKGKKNTGLRDKWIAHRKRDRKYQKERLSKKRRIGAASKQKIKN